MGLQKGKSSDNQNGMGLGKCHHPVTNTATSEKCRKFLHIPPAWGYWLWKQRWFQNRPQLLCFSRLGCWKKIQEYLHICLNKFNSFFLVRGAFVGLQHCQFSPALLSLSFLQHCQFSAPSLNLCQLANKTKVQQKTLIMSFFRKYLLDSELWTAHRVWKYRHY